MEIRLRVYDKENEKMIYANDQPEQDKCEYIPFEFGIGFSGWDKSWLSELMICIGLQDKKRTDIYVGDIVKDEYGILYTIYYDRNFATYYLWSLDPMHGADRTFRIDKIHLAEVVSNVFEATGDIEETLIALKLKGKI